MVIIHVVGCQNNYLQHFSRICNLNVINLYINGSVRTKWWVIINLPILGTFLSQLLIRPNKNILAQVVTL